MFVLYYDCNFNIYGRLFCIVIVILLFMDVQQILDLAHNKSEIERRVRAVIDKFAERGLRSLGVAYQV
jgi:magnesium-transporting ATPase (P-type)